MAMSKEQWQGKCFVAISVKNGSTYNFGAYTSDIKITGGDKDFKGQPINNGGRIKQYDPQTDWQVEVTCFPVSVNPSDGSVTQIFDGQTIDNSDPYQSVNTNSHTEVRLALLWTDDSSVSSAVDEVSAGNEGFRIYWTNGEIISETFDWTDQKLGGTFIFKAPAFNKSGSGTRHVESTETTGVSALGDYT